jgi:hypothetical protein
MLSMQNEIVAASSAGDASFSIRAAGRHPVAQAEKFLRDPPFWKTPKGDFVWSDR